MPPSLLVVKTSLSQHVSESHIDTKTITESPHSHGANTASADRHFALKSWFLEKNVFQYGASNNSLFEVGHYTQMVWYSTHKVGCGWTHCKHATPVPYYNYVCNYCPT